MHNKYIMGFVKSNSDVRALKEAGRITQDVLQALCEALQPGITTPELEAMAVALLAKNRSSAPFRSFDSFNHATCISINEEIVNAPPSRGRTLQPGDLVSIATAAEHRGLHAKAAFTTVIGAIPSPEETRLLQGTAAVIENVIAQSKHVATLNELLAVIPQTAAQYQLTVFQNLGGAGIGKKLHEWPAIPNNPDDLTEVTPLQPGLCFTLMPMFSLGESSEFIVHEDGWTFVPKDSSLSAHFADTLLMTDEGLTPITTLAAHTLSRLFSGVSSP